MIQRIGPVSIGWAQSVESPAQTHQSADWWVSVLNDRQAQAKRGPEGARWFNEDGWGGIETPDWMAWINNHSRTAHVWGAADTDGVKQARSVVVPAVLRREGLLDGHGAVVAPDTERPDEALFVTGLSGSGKSTMTVAAAVDGARFVSDDAVAIGLEQSGIRAWSRRSLISVGKGVRDRLLPEASGPEMNDKIWLDGEKTFAERKVNSLAVRAVVFLTPPDHPRFGAVTQVEPLSAMEAYRLLLMGHPILAVDSGARKCFPALRALADLPASRLTIGPDIFGSPAAARSTLASLLPA